MCRVRSFLFCNFENLAKLDEFSLLENLLSQFFLVLKKQEILSPKHQWYRVKLEEDGNNLKIRGPKTR
jgi:hypothetical protein